MGAMKQIWADTAIERAESLQQDTDYLKHVIRNALEIVEAGIIFEGLVTSELRALAEMLRPHAEKRILVTTTEPREDCTVLDF